MNDLLERDLREALERRAAEARPSPWAARRVRAKVERAERRSVAGRTLAAVGLAAAVLTTAAILIDAQGTDAARTVPNDGAPSTTERTAEPAAGTPGDLDLVLGGGQETGRSEDPSPAAAQPVPHLRVYDNDAPGGGPMLFVYTVPADVGWGIGEGADPSVSRRVTVHGRQGVLLHGNERSPSLGWRWEDGTTVYLKGWEVTADDLLSFGERIGSRLPDFPRVVEGDLTAPAGVYREVRYRFEGGEVTVRTMPAGPMSLLSRLADRLDAATEHTVAPLPAALHGDGGARVAHTEDGWTAMWVDGATLVEVVGQGVSVDEALANLHRTTA